SSTSSSRASTNPSSPDSRPASSQPRVSHVSVVLVGSVADRSKDSHTSASFHTDAFSGFPAIAGTSLAQQTTDHAQAARQGRKNQEQDQVRRRPDAPRRPRSRSPTPTQSQNRWCAAAPCPPTRAAPAAPSS